MKTIALLAVASLAFVGCDQQSDRMDESAGAEKSRIEQSKDAQQDALNQQKKSIEQSADQAKDQISAQAKAEKQRLESQTDAEKAQIEAEKKQVEAEADAAKADVNAQQKIEEAAGATTTDKNTGLTAQDQGTSEADRKITMEIRQSLTSQTTPTDLSTAAKNVTIITKDGMVTLKGTVKTEAEKADLEARAKAASGVKSVDNKLEVKSE
jgi:hyperosmotically inducible periplasmic protein